jgi:hypothetical protein
MRAICVNSRARRAGQQLFDGLIGGVAFVVGVIAAQMLVQNPRRIVDRPVVAVGVKRQYRVERSHDVACGPVERRLGV